MADFLITRRGGGAGELTPPPSINFVSATFDSITFTITNNSVSARDITYGLTTPPEDTSIILGGSTTSDEIILSALDDGTSYTIYAQAEDSTIIEVTLSTTPWEPIQATGGTITTVNDYRIHAFTSVGTSTLNVTNVGTDGLIEYVIVAGGGGGGSRHGGGGGAGGLLTNVTTSGFIISNTNYTVTVGNGGNGTSAATAPTINANGQNSVVFGFTAIGGGRGGGYNIQSNPNGFTPGAAGGSGGGGAVPTSGTASGGAGTSGQGFAGGAAPYQGGAGWPGAGGGGAGGVGQNVVNSSTGGNGGTGLNLSTYFPNWGTNSSNTTTGTRGWFAGGGRGANTASPNFSSNTIPGGGGGSFNNESTSGNGSPGLANTGGGGGAGRGTLNAGGAGGSGIVLIRYPLVRPN